MDMNRIEQAIENRVINGISNGQVIEMPYHIIDGKPYVEEAFKNINIGKVMAEVTERLEHELAEKIVNKVVTEMGTDIKELMSHKEIRDDFRYMLRKNIDVIFEKINKG